MPQDTVTVDRVDTFTGTVWTIKGDTAKGDYLTFTTNKPWIASLADRAKLLKQPVQFGWRDTSRFGRDIVTAGMVNP